MVNRHRLFRFGTVGVMLLSILSLFTHCGGASGGGETASTSNANGGAVFSDNCSPKTIGTVRSARIKCVVENFKIEPSDQISISGTECKNVVREGSTTFYCDTPAGLKGVHDIAVTKSDGRLLRLPRAIGYSTCGEGQFPSDYYRTRRYLKQTTYSGDTISLLYLCGVSPFKYSIDNGGGEIIDNEKFKAPENQEGVSRIKFEDAMGDSEFFSISYTYKNITAKINSTNIYSNYNKTTAISGQKFEVEVFGGKPPYTIEYDSNLVEKSIDGVDIINPNAPKGEYSIKITDDRGVSLDTILVLDSFTARLEKKDSTVGVLNTIIVGSTHSASCQIISGEAVLNKAGSSYNTNEDTFQLTPISEGKIEVECSNKEGAKRRISTQAFLNINNLQDITVGQFTEARVSPLGGKPPYSYKTLNSQIDIIDPDGSIKTTSAGRFNVEVSDSASGATTFSVFVESRMTITIPSPIGGLSTVTATFTGGRGPFRATVISGKGRIISPYFYNRSFEFESMDFNETIVRVVDSLGIQEDIKIIKISPELDEDFQILDIAQESLYPTGDISYCKIPVRGGLPPYSYHITRSGCATINSDGTIPYQPALSGICYRYENFTQGYVEDATGARKYFEIGRGRLLIDNRLESGYYLRSIR